jgi:putative membrane protein
MPSDHRLHPTSILFSMAGGLKAFLLPAIILLVTTGRSSRAPSGSRGFGPGPWMSGWMPGDVEIANWQFWFLLFLIPSALVAVARYLSFRLQYEGTELVIRSGIIFRNERHVPYARIQNLDAVRSVAHRLLGVAEVRVETGGGQAPEATISVLHDTVFEEMRRRIFEGRARVAQGDVRGDAAQTDTAAPTVAVVEPRTLLYLPPRELLLNGVIDNRGMVLVAAVYGLAWQTGLFRDVWGRLARGAFGPDFVRETMLTLAAGGVPSLARIAVVLGGVVGLLLLVRVLSMAWSWIRLHEFRLSRVGEDLRTQYGLLTHVTTTVPLRRVQMLTIRETPLQRLVKRMSVRVETAGGHGHGASENGPKQPREWLAPIVRRAAVPALVREVLPGMELSALQWQPLHPRAFQRGLKPAALIALATTAPIVGLLGVRGLLVLPFTLTWLGVVTWKQVQHMQWAATEDAVAFRSGWLWRHVTVAPVVKIQTVSCNESPFDRRAAMATLQVDTAGGGLHRITVPYLARETAKTLYDKLATQTAQTAFRW